MALGLARMFSLEFPINFNSPFKAQSIVDFWQRWHMTLSRYLNEYLYTPISRWMNGRRIDAGKKVSRKATLTPEGFFQMVAFPTLSTMFLAGIWHGAGLQFLLFGVLHGSYLTINHAWRLWTPKGDTTPPDRSRSKWMILVTFLAVHVSLVFFRSASVAEGMHVLALMAGLRHGPGFAAFPYLAAIPGISRFLTHQASTVAVLGVCFLIIWAAPNSQEILGETGKDHVRLPNLLPGLRWRVSALWSLGITALFCVSILLLDASARFLYFQF